MFYIGKKVRYIDNDAVVLTWLEDEVLLFIEENYVKWWINHLLTLYNRTCKGNML